MSDQIEGDRANPLVLLADDEQLILKLGSRILINSGFRVCTAGDGEEAVEAYLQNQEEIKLVMLDARMPKLTGIQACRLIRAKNPSAKLVLVTGCEAEEPGIKEVVRETGARVLEKPYKAEELVALVRQFLSEQ